MAPRLSDISEPPPPPPPPLTSEQQEWFELGLPALQPCATEVARWANRWCKPPITPESLLGAGFEGLHEAARKYREELCPAFLYFAKSYIRGRMLNAIREENLSLRARVERAMTGAACRAARRQALAIDTFAAAEEDILDECRRVDAAQLAEAFLAAMTEAQRATPEDALGEIEEQRALSSLLEESLASLDPAEREMIDLVHTGQMEIGEAARAIGVHRNTGSNRYRRALDKLRDVIVQRRMRDG